MSTPAAARLDWQIVPIGACPQHIAQLAAWHHAQWGTLMAPWSLAEAHAELAEHAACSGFPTTLVAQSIGGELLGSISLVATDAPEFPEYSPWLASLYVHPYYRQQGLGAALVEAITTHAQQLAYAQIFLFTPDAPDFYRRLGWQMMETRQIGDRPVCLMTRYL